MSLRMDLVAAQLPAVVDRYQAVLVATGAALDEASGALKRWNADLHGANFRVEQAMRDQAVPYALALAENPSATFAPEACPPLTVVAVDGSSIAPDRFAAVRCYALNVGHASLPYGVSREADLGATAEVGLDRELLDDAADIRAAPRGLAVRLLRDVRELDRDGMIPGALHAPRGMLEFWVDPASPYHRDVFANGKKFVFYCASGWRSALAAETLQDMGLEPVAHIEGGFTAWKEAGGPVGERPRKGG